MLYIDVSIFDGTLPAVHSGWWWSVESTHTQVLLHNNNKQLVSRWSDARPLREATPYDAIRRRDAPSASAENNPKPGPGMDRQMEGGLSPRRKD